MGPPPYPLEYILRDATAPDGRYHGNFGREDSVIVDWPFVTGRSTTTPSSRQKMVEVLEDGVRLHPHAEETVAVGVADGYARAAAWPVPR